MSYQQPNQKQQPKPQGTLVATARRSDTVREYYSVDPNANTQSLPFAQAVYKTPVYYDSAGNEVPGDAVAGFSSGFPHTYADLAAANAMFLARDRTFGVGQSHANTYQKKRRKSAEHEDWAQINSGGGLERTGENFEEPTETGKEVSASSGAPNAATSVHRYKLAAPDGQTWLFGDEIQETTLRDRVRNGFVLFCNCSSDLVTTYGPITAGGEAEELGIWFNESRPVLHRAPTSRSPTVSTSGATKKVFCCAPQATLVGEDRMAACTQPYDEPIEAPYHYGKRKLGGRDDKREGDEEWKRRCGGVGKANEELLRVEEEGSSPASSESSQRSEDGSDCRGSEASSHTVGRSDTSSRTIGRSEAGASSPRLSDSSHTLGRSEAGSETAGSKQGQESPGSGEEEKFDESEDEGDVFSKSSREGSAR